MDESKTLRERIWSIIHIIIGGGLSFFVIFVLSAVAQTGVETLVSSMGSAGVLIFDQAVSAFYIIMFGIVYLPSGFCGGLYTGYKTEEDLKIALAVTGIIGFVILTILSFYSGSVNLSSIQLVNQVLVPLSGMVIGAYLGGYTISWETEEEPEEEFKIRLDIGK